VVKAIEDLDFSAEIESEDGSSYFASEGSIQLFDFYVATESVEEFATALEALCEQHENEDSFYFDYEESEEDGITYAIITNFDLSLDDPDTFLEELDALCNEWADDENYDFSVEGYDDSEEEGEGEEESDEQEFTLTLTGFYIYTDDGEKVVAKIDKLCSKHTTDDDYSYEWEESEDENGTYIDFSSFEITPDDEEAFLEALEALCEKISNDNGYSWD
jgi:quinol monooxygenase YgiN